MRQKVELVNINNSVREDWIKTIDCIGSFCEDEYDQGTLMYEVIENMKKTKPKYYRLFVSIMFADYYKLLYFHSVRQESTDEDLDKLEFFDEIEDLDNLLDKIDDDASVLDEIVSEGFLYNYYDYYEKREIMNSLNPKNKYLFKICPTHLLDLIEMAKTYSADDLLCFYQDYINKNGVHSYFSAVESILVTMEALYKYDKENYKEVLINMISVYYKWKKYLISYAKHKNLIIYDSELIEMLEKESIDNIMINSNRYPLVLEEIVEGYLLYSTEEIKIPSDEIEKYINKNVDNQIKEKLNLFKPKIKSLD